MRGWWAISYVVLWVVVIVLSLVVALARQIGTLHLRLAPRGALEVDAEGPPLGRGARAGGRAPARPASGSPWAVRASRSSCCSSPPDARCAATSCPRSAWSPAPVACCRS